MKQRPKLSTVLKALGSSLENTSTVSSAIFSSLENSRFQEAAKQLWFPRVLKTIHASDELGPSGEQYLLNKDGSMVNLKFLCAQLACVNHFTWFTQYSFCMDFTFGEEEDSLLYGSNSRAYYAAHRIFTAQCSLFVEQVNGQEMMAVSNLIYTKTKEDRPPIGELPQAEVENHYLPVGAYMGMTHMKFSKAPRLRKAYGGTDGGTDLELDAETMMFYEKGNPSKKVIPAMLLQGAYSEPRFPDYLLADALDNHTPSPRGLLEDIAAQMMLDEDLDFGTPMPYNTGDSDEVTEKDLEAVEEFLNQYDVRSQEDKDDEDEDLDLRDLE